MVFKIYGIQNLWYSKFMVFKIYGIQNLWYSKFIQILFLF